ncbi:hypothetical protein [Streptomyces pseudovenezuelae]|uniref:Uncharacterized protein n=1 Tax=Streptomyces pseudovenezuelae TaxID=67350 RepID=A0ABT6M2K9_9ACTN|nr:hypothetical protein [Streptomyces pseudovenezuelae]MDH6222785.1 hypothetical protein [Streptomyces pseudovenezuelae]
MALFGVALGGWLSLRNQDRAWQREHQRQWRDIRLTTCNEFLAANRRYVAYVLDPRASITALPHPREQGRMMPFFDETGRPYKEALEAGFTAMRLVSERAETVRAGVSLVNWAREVAAARATLSEADISSATFESLWTAEQDFINAVRVELGLATMARQP